MVLASCDGWKRLEHLPGGGSMTEPRVVVAHREHLWWLLVPWREPAWAMALLAQRCAEATGTHGPPQALHETHQRVAIATAIAAHVPADLRPPTAGVALAPGSRE